MEETSKTEDTDEDTQREPPHEPKRRQDSRSPDRKDERQRKANLNRRWPPGSDPGSKETTKKEAWHHYLPPTSEEAWNTLIKTRRSLYAREEEQGPQTNQDKRTARRAAWKGKDRDQEERRAEIQMKTASDLRTMPKVNRWIKSQQEESDTHAEREPQTPRHWTHAKETMENLLTYARLLRMAGQIGEEGTEQGGTGQSTKKRGAGEGDDEEPTPNDEEWLNAKGLYEKIQSRTAKGKEGEWEPSDRGEKKQDAGRISHQQYWEQTESTGRLQQDWKETKSLYNQLKVWGRTYRPNRERGYKKYKCPEGDLAELRKVLRNTHGALNHRVLIQRCQELLQRATERAAENGQRKTEAEGNHMQRYVRHWSKSKKEARDQAAQRAAESKVENRWKTKTRECLDTAFRLLRKEWTLESDPIAYNTWDRNILTKLRWADASLLEQSTECGRIEHTGEEAERDREHIQDQCINPTRLAIRRELIHISQWIKAEDSKNINKQRAERKKQAKERWENLERVRKTTEELTNKRRTDEPMDILKWLRHIAKSKTNKREKARPKTPKENTGGDTQSPRKKEGPQGTTETPSPPKKQPSGQPKRYGRPKVPRLPKPAKNREPTETTKGTKRAEVTTDTKATREKRPRRGKEGEEAPPRQPKDNRKEDKVRTHPPQRATQVKESQREKTRGPPPPSQPETATPAPTPIPTPPDEGRP